MTRPAPRFCLRGVLAALLLLGAGWPVMAQAAGPVQTAAAADAFRQAQASFHRGDYEAALAGYQRSQALFPNPDTLYNIALSQERLLRYDDAIATLERFLLESTGADQTARRLRLLAERSRQRLRALPARVTVSTVPPGAEVRLLPQSADEGTPPPQRSPATFGVRAGRYVVHLRLPGYQDDEQTIEVGVGQALLLQRSLAVHARSLTVQARPAALLYLDDRLLGRTQDPIGILPGEHRLRLEHALYVTHSASLRIPPGEAPLRYRVTLRRSGYYELLAAAALGGAGVGLVALRVLNPGLPIENISHGDLWKPLVAAPVGAALALGAAALVGRSNMPIERAQLLIGNAGFGTLLGFGVGLVYSPQDLTPHLFAIAGGLAGGVAALAVAQRLHLTSGQVALYNSAALWGATFGALAWAYLAILQPSAGFFGVPAQPMAVTAGQPGFLSGGCVYGGAQPAGVPLGSGGRCRIGGVPLLVGTGLGVALGITLAGLPRLDRLTRAQVALIDIAGVSGGLSVGLLALGIGYGAFGRDVGLRAGVTGAAAGAAGGLITGMLLSRRFRAVLPEPGQTEDLGQLSSRGVRLLPPDVAFTPQPGQFAARLDVLRGIF